MSLITVDYRSRKLIYMQIVDNVKNLVMSAQIKPDEALPSVRSLSKELGINPNTIQKAYAELEREGIIASYPGRGSIVCSSLSMLAETTKQKAYADISDAASRCRIAGVPEEEFLSLCAEAWRENLNKSASEVMQND